MVEQARILEAKQNKVLLDPENQKIFAAVRKLKDSPKRKFSQSIELIINLKELDIKKEEAKIDEFIVLPAGRGKNARVCAFVGSELKDQAAKHCDSFMLESDFDKIDKRKIRNLAKNNDFFIAQANIMPAVAKVFGRYLSPIGKMPSPKAGHVVPPRANIESLVKNLKQTVRVTIKKAPVFQTMVGNETLPDEAIVQNIVAVLDRIKMRLPKGEHNIKSVLVKKTMGGPVKL